MAVTYLGVFNRSSTNNGAVRIYTHVHKLRASSETDSEVDVENNANLPVIGSVHAGNSLAYCNDIKTVNVTPYAHWEVTTTYSTERTIDATNPENDEVLTSFDGEAYQTPFHEDQDGAAVVNSAGDYYLDPPPTRDEAHLIARIVSNHASIPSWVLDYQNAVNNGPITIGGLSIAQGLAKMWPIRVSERKKRGNDTYYTLTQEIHIHKDGWTYKPLDAGYHELTTDQPRKKKEITLPGGGVPSQPVPLDGDGQQLTSTDPSDAVINEHQRYPELDFTVLPGIT